MADPINSAGLNLLNTMQLKIKRPVSTSGLSRQNRNALRCSQILIVLGLLALVQKTQAIQRMGDDAELFVTGVASVAYNDNAFLSHSGAKSATIFDFVPGLAYEYGQNHSLTKVTLSAYEDFQFYSGDSGNLKNQLENLVFSTRYDDQKSKFNLDASYHQADQPQVGLQNLGFLVNRDLIHAGALEEFAFTEKSSVSGAVAFDNTDYRDKGFSDWRYVEVPVKYYYKIEPKIDLSAGFRYRDNTVGGTGLDSHDLYYNVGARGRFTPRLTGDFDVGYNEQDITNGQQNSSFGANANLTYEYDPKTSFSFTGSDDYGYSAAGASYRNAGIAGGVKTLLYEQWSVDGRIGYNKYTYLTTAQNDDFYNAQVGVAYLINARCSVRAAYTYAQDHSNIRSASFENNIFTLSISGRF